MKQKIPTFDELINRLCHSVKLRHPEDYDEQHSQTRFRSEWFGKDKKLYELVKSLEQQEHKVENEINSYDSREVEFVVGRDLIGNPIICSHKVLFKKKTTKWNGRPSKNGSKSAWSANYKFIGRIFKHQIW